MTRKTPEPGMFAFVCVHVGRQNAPILFVSRQAPTDPQDSGWCFACGQASHDTADWLLVLLDRYFERDPSLDELLGMPEGYAAERREVGGEWQIEPDPQGSSEEEEEEEEVVAQEDRLSIIERRTKETLALTPEGRNDPVKVRYDGNETGWVLPIEHDLVRIDNTPCSDRYNVGDLVELAPPQGDSLPRLGRVVRREYDRKTRVFYDENWQFWEMKAIVRILGGEIEGMVEAGENTPGLMLISHGERINGVMLAEALGLRVNREA